MRVKNLFGEYEEVQVRKSKSTIEVEKIDKDKIRIPQDVLEYIYKEPNKKYYSIGEVANLFQVKTSLLRYWEEQFSQINPSRTANGVRKFTKKDIELLNTIHYFLKIRKWRIKGVQDYLSREFHSQNSTKKLLVHHLDSIKKKLLSIYQELDNKSN